jgi:hypothetical protein
MPQAADEQPCQRTGSGLGRLNVTFEVAASAKSGSCFGWPRCWPRCRPSSVTIRGSGPPGYGGDRRYRASPGDQHGVNRGGEDGERPGHSEGSPTGRTLPAVPGSHDREVMRYGSSRSDQPRSTAIWRMSPRTFYMKPRKGGPRRIRARDRFDIDSAARPRAHILPTVTDISNGLW